MKASSPSYFIFFLKILKMNCSSSCVIVFIAAKSISASLLRVLTPLVLSKSFLFTASFYFSYVSIRSILSSGTMSMGSFLISLWFWILMSSIPSGEISLDFSDFFPSLSFSLLSEIMFSYSSSSMFSSYFSSSGNASPSFLTTYSNI